VFFWWLSNLGMGGGGGAVGAQLLRQAVYARLSGSSAITAIVGTRIYFGALPQSAQLPALTFWVVTRPHGHNLGGSDGISAARIQVSAWSFAESSSDQLVQAIRDRFDGFTGTINGVTVTASIKQDELDIPHPPKAGTDQWIYETACDYRVNHRITLPASLGADGGLTAAQLRQAVYARLTNSTALTALVGTRIYEGALPQSATLPAVTYSLASRPYGHNLAGSDGTSQARVRLSAWSFTESGADQVGETIRGRYDGIAGTIGSVVVTASLQEDEIDTPHEPRAGTDQWIYEVGFSYQINHQVTLPASLAP